MIGRLRLKRDESYRNVLFETLCITVLGKNSSAGCASRRVRERALDGNLMFRKHDLKKKKNARLCACARVGIYTYAHVVRGGHKYIFLNEGRAGNETRRYFIFPAAAAHLRRVGTAAAGTSR